MAKTSKVYTHEKEQHNGINVEGDLRKEEQFNSMMDKKIALGFPKQEFFQGKQQERLQLLLQGNGERDIIQDG